MKLAAVVVAGVLLCRAAPAGAQTNPRPMNAADAFELKDIAEIIVSPDGARVLFTVNTTFLNANRMISKLMSMPAAGGQPAEVAGVPAGANTFRWSPDGTRIAFFGT